MSDLDIQYETQPVVPEWRRMRFLGEYDPSVVYVEGDVVRDGEWTMFANYPTQERPAPQPDGAPFWGVQFDPDPPTWTTGSETVGQVIVGMRFQNTGNAFWATQFRFWGKPNHVYTPFVVRNPTTAPAVSAQPPITPLSEGWHDIGIGEAIVTPGVWLDIGVRIEPESPTEVQWNGEWVYNRANGAPAPGEANHESGGGNILFSTTDVNSADRYTDLATVRAGDTITAPGQVWDVTGATDNTDHFVFGVSPSTRLLSGQYSFVFDVVVPELIEYTYVPDYWPEFWGPDPDVKANGFYSSTGYDNMVEDLNAYGVDLFVQRASASEHWEMVAYSSFGI